MKTIQTQSAQTLNPIDPQIIVKHGESPTAIILAIAILLLLVCHGLTGLIQVILRRKK
jgi:succinate dehydrogenase hydrophobic anchor subunit